MEVSMEAKMQPDAEQLKKLLEDAPHNPDFLALM
jgi:hypothetical protein